MGAPFVWANQANRLALGAGATQTQFIMPNQPISAVILTVEAQLTTANTADSITNFLAQLTNVMFTWKGTSIWNLRGDDLVRLSRALGCHRGRFEVTSQVANARRIYTITIPFGRKLFDQIECFPAVDKGTSILQINCAGDGGGYNGYKVTVDVLQMLTAQPTQFLRSITFSDTPSAAGNKDYDLPRLYPMVAIGITTTNSEPAATLDDIETIKILQNFQDYDYSLISANTARSMQYLYSPPGFDDTEFIVGTNTGAAYAQFAPSITHMLSGDLTRNFHMLHFDPLRDGSTILDASKSTDLKMRLQFNTAAAIRFFPVELWPASALKPSNQQ